MKYKFIIIETLERIVEVEDQDVHSAYKQVYQQYMDEEIVLTADDHTNTEIAPYCDERVNKC